MHSTRDFTEAGDPASPSSASVTSDAGRRHFALPHYHRLALVSCALSVGAATSLCAQGPGPTPQAAHFLVTTTANVPASGALRELDDASLLRVHAGAEPQAAFTEGNWLATGGFVPGDVDALAQRPGTVSGHHGAFAFSLLSNEAGFLDGDVLGFAPGGGVEIVLAEEELATALGLPDANLDVDAMTWVDASLFLFSLQSDLDGTVLGPVSDGDVLGYDSAGVVSLALSELEVQQKFTQATGSSAAIGDVQALSRFGSELLAATQGPSSSDGALLSLGNAPEIVVDEDGVGLGGAEIDGLMQVDPDNDPGRLRVSSYQAMPGETLTATYTGGQPFRPIVTLPSGKAGFLETPQFAGFGAWYVDFLDPWLGMILSGPTVPLTILDGNGELVLDFTLPSSDLGGVGWGGESGWSFQALDLVSFQMSAPYRIEIL